MRILFCTLGYEPGPVGGAEHQAKLQAEALVKRGHDVEVVCPRARGTVSRRRNGVMIHRLPAPSRRTIRVVVYPVTLAIWLLRRRRRFDLVHVHLANLQADAAAAALVGTGVPLYVKLAAGGPRGEIGRLRRISRLTRYFGIRRARRVQAISQEIAADAHRVGVAADRIVRIPNGIRLDLSPVDAPAARSALGLPGGVLVLYVGRFAAYKGVPDLLEAWRRIDHSESTLVLVGEQAVDAPLRAMPNGERVEVRAWTDTTRRYHEACDVFVLPSHSEGMSNALLEAMISGMAVVATRVGAATEMVEDGVSGLLVEPGHPDQLASVLQRVTSDADLRRRLGSAAREFARNRYDIQSVVDRIEATYREMLAEVRL